MEIKNKRPLLSVCLITYNHAQYIRQAIESVLMQETSFVWELIIADDFSVDGTRGIVEEYGRKYPDFIRLIIQKENIGPDRNCSELLAYPRSKYIAYLEGDDYWTDSKKLQKQVDFLEAYQDYAGCAHQSTILLPNGDGGLFGGDVSSEICINDIIGGRPFHTASIVFRRNILNIRFNSPKVFSGDRLLYFCICISGKMKYFNESMCVYRKHIAGASSTATVKQLQSDLNCISYLNSIFPSFPRYRYMSYVYATIGFCKNASLLQRTYFLTLSFLFSFSYFPKNWTSK